MLFVYWFLGYCYLFVLCRICFSVFGGLWLVWFYFVNFGLWVLALFVVAYIRLGFGFDLLCLVAY